MFVLASCEVPARSLTLYSHSLPSVVINLSEPKPVLTNALTKVEERLARAESTGTLLDVRRTKDPAVSARWDL